MIRHNKVLKSLDGLPCYHEPFHNKIKSSNSMELWMYLWHLNNMKVMLTLWTMNHVDCVLFSCIYLFHIVHNRVKFFKKNLNLQTWDKHQIFINLTNVYVFIGWFLNDIAFDEIKWLCAFTKQTAKIYNKATIHVNELILIPFSPFVINYKILTLLWKTSGNVFLRHLGGWFFLYFSEFAL